MLTYKKLYSELVGWRPKVDELHFPTLDTEEKIWLDKYFEREKIAHALKEMKGDKAPGLDSFAMAFFQRYFSVTSKGYFIKVN